MEPRLLAAGRVGPTRRWRMDRHRHAHHELIVVFHGLLRLEMGGRSLTGAEGDVLLYPAGVDHEETADPQAGLDMRFIAFEWPDAPDEPPAMAHDAGGRLRQLLRWIETDWVGPALHGRPAAEALLPGALGEWSRQAAGETPPLVARLRRFMQARLADPLTLDDLADQAGMSKYHFARRYRALSGQTPMEDLRAIRMEHARGLLLTTDLPLKAIAPRVGLASEYHLCRLFARHFGQPPGRMRSAARR